MHIALDVISWCCALVWAGISALSCLGLRRLCGLPPAPEVLDPSEPVSVVVAARDEERRIENTVRCILGQRGVAIDLTVVDDRSTDGTSAILERISREEQGLRVLRVDHLPEGWLGKCHACHLGASQARGEWLLFTDADTLMVDDVVARAVHAAHRAGADHFCIAPGLADTTVGGRAIAVTITLTLVLNAGFVNSDRFGAFVGIGAFNLVRAKAYRAVGGHEALRTEVVDDMRLAFLLRRAGYRSRVALNPRDIEVEWITTMRSFFALTEKNFFACFEYRVARLLAVFAAAIGLWAVAVAGPLLGTPAGWAAGIALASLVLPAAAVARRYGWSPGLAVWAPLCVPVVFFAMLHSAVTTLRRGGIVWRGTFYEVSRP